MFNPLRLPILSEQQNGSSRNRPEKVEPEARQPVEPYQRPEALTQMQTCFLKHKEPELHIPALSRVKPESVCFPKSPARGEQKPGGGGGGGRTGFWY